MAACEEARKIDRDYAEIAATYVDALCLKAEWNQVDRKPARSFLEQARKALALAQVRDAVLPSLHERRARVELLSVKLGTAAASSLALAERALELAKTQSQPTPSGLNLAVRLAVQRALLLPRGADPSAVLGIGLAAVEASLAMNPRQGEALALKGQIHLLKAQASRDPVHRLEAGRTAKALLEKALALNGFLKPEWKQMLTDAEMCANP
jgi:hypothetical protein